MIGTTLSHYRIVDELGRGGMGIVYKAEDTKLDRTVALKVLPSSALSSEDDRARFYREAKAAAALNHPHIAQVYEIDEAVPEGGDPTELRPFIAMEYVEGPTLEGKLKAGLFSLQDAVATCIQVAQALEAAHDKNIVHRDIKSANIMVTAKGQAKVLDFGLAKTAHSTMLTRMGSTMGTVSYMSPEQARGEEVDRRTDLWALGVVLYELITGKHPFPGDYEQAVVYGILNEDPAPMTSVRAGVPMSLDWIVGKLLAKKADDRYQSAGDLLVDLRTADLSQAGLSRASATTRATSAAAAMTGGKPQAPSSSRLLPAGLLIAGIILGGLAVFLLRPAPPPAPVRYAEQHYEFVSDSRWPALSESGRYLALAGRDSAQTVPLLRIHDLQTNVIVTIPGSEFPVWPAFSFDETKIAFVSRGSLHIGDVVGSDPVEVAPASPETVVWDQDGSLYFVTPGFQLTVVTPAGRVEPFMPADTVITGYFPMSIVTPGKTLAVARNEPGGGSSGTFLDLESGQMSRFMDDGVWYSRFTEPAHLIVQSQQSGRLSAVPVDVKKAQVSGLPQPIRPSIVAWEWFVTRSGHFVSFGNRTITEREMLELDGEGSLRSLIEEQLDFEEFQFSPSGRYITAEVNGYQNGSDQLLLFDLQTGLSRQLTFSGSWFEPTWSPDGEKIAFSAFRSSSQELGVLRLDGSSDIQWLTSSQNTVGDPDWSPSGDFLVYDGTGQDNDFDILMYTFADSTERPLVEGQGRQQYPRVSHDNRFIAYESDVSRTTEVWVFDRETGASTMVSRNGGTRPVWGPEDDELYFATGMDLYRVPVSTEAGFQVTGQAESVVRVGSNFYFDVSDDGRIGIARQAAGGSADVQIIYNWATTLSPVP